MPLYLRLERPHPKSRPIRNVIATETSRDVVAYEDVEAAHEIARWCYSDPYRPGAETRHVTVGRSRVEVVWLPELPSHQFHVETPYS